MIADSLVHCPTIRSIGIQKAIIVSAMKVAVGVLKSSSVLASMSSVDFISKPLLSGSKNFLTLFELEELNVRLLKVEGGKGEGDDEEGTKDVTSVA